MSLLKLVFLVLIMRRGDSVCRLLGWAEPPELYQDGNLILGGIFSFRTGQDGVINTFQEVPQVRTCKNFNVREFKFAQTMIFAINEINRNPEMLPDVKLGYNIYDTCGTMDILRAALALMSGQKREISENNCTERDTVQAIIGHSGSRPTIAIAQIVGRFHIPVVSHFATCACLNNRKEYPTFFRTIPSDLYQSKALAQLVKHFGWTWIGAIAVENEYGLNGMAAFIHAAQENGVCIEYSESFSQTGPAHRLQRIVETIKQSTSTVIMAFMSHREIKVLATELYKQNITGLQWVGSDAWITDHSLTDSQGHSILVGSLGFTVTRGRIPGLDKHLREVHPSQFPDSQFVKDFWEDVFDCSLKGTAEVQRKKCSGFESLQDIESQFTDVSALRFTNNVYKSVYAVAHALHKLFKCEGGQGPFSSGGCADTKHIQQWQVLQYLSTVNFTTKEGEQIYFDSNGDSPARYELVNLRRTNTGTMEGVTVGFYDASLAKRNQFIMNNVSVVWGGGQTKVPVSVCSESCPSGTHMALQKGKPICCYDCVPCPSGEISNLTNSIHCMKCPMEYWPNTHRDACIPKTIEFLAYGEIMGSLLALFSLLGVFLTVITTLVFYCHKETPLVRANNSELSFLLLFSLTLCFLCSLTFIGRPSEWSCMLRHTVFGITFVLCISCVLGKTIVVLMAFRATLPGSNVMKWFGPAQQRLSVLTFTLIQVLICIVWLTISPPFPFKNFLHFKEKIIFECALGSAIGFWAVLGYIALLAMLCFILAFLARKLPDNFNEAKFITFSMLIFCAVWITFIPAYVSSPGKFSVAVEIFAILASSYGLLFCIFLPKCYIILLKPEQNTKKHLMGKTESENQTCKVIGQTGFMEFSKDGDLTIGGVFSITGTRKLEDNGYQAVPYSYCTKRNDRELKFARTVVFTVEEINRNTELLPGVTLGYELYNGCGSENLLRAAIEAVNGEESKEQGCKNRIQALLGHSSSGVSEYINKIIGPFSIPQISHLSTCACLSDKKLYPTFFRTVPSDRFQIIALLQLMKHFGWRWVGIVYSVSLYATQATAEFTKEAKKEGICTEYRQSISRSSVSTFEATAETIRNSSSKVVLLFMSLSYTKVFLTRMEKINITGKQWVGSESWITQADLASASRKSILQGAMGFAIPEASIPGLAGFLLNLKPSDEPESSLIRAFWEDAFHCSFSPSNTSTMCNGTEDLTTVSNDYTDMKEFRAVNNVYKAVYAVAHALHTLLQCKSGSNPTTGKHCVSKTDVHPKQVLEHLRLVNFTTQDGDKVLFDENGDTVAQYDLVNWQMSEDGSVDIVNIGCYDSSSPERKKFKLNDNIKIIWGGNHSEIPRSVCREPCPPGTRKALNKRKPVCCFDCFECPEGTISNQTNSPDCLICPPEFWPNKNKDQCLPKPTEYISYREIMGALLTGFCCLGVFLSLLTSIIFLVHKETPIVKANNSELSFLLLFSLKLCFLCSLTFIGRPSEWSCMLRHTAFGITFVLCISCVLGKTIVVLMAFRATLPGSNVMKWFGPAQQRLSVLAFTLIQVLICILWLTINPPFPNRNMKYYKEKIILECALGSAIGFWAVLGYIGLLALMCFMLAFLARKLPDSFNEAKFITFSMLIFCAVWITFIPAYVSSPGKFTVAVEIFAILASSFGLLICIFVPKCYIMIFKPELNSKKHMMGKVPSRAL
ncbi:extracellular calcium-sensing receptor-like [Diretmus argenteus]